MTDFFLELGKNPTARKLIKTVGLPVPMPQSLRRAKGPAIGLQHAPIAQRSRFAVAVVRAAEGCEREPVALERLAEAAEPLEDDGALKMQRSGLGDAPELDGEF